MIQQSIKIGIRRLTKFKTYSSINIGGLGIAISVCLVILTFTAYHYSFDKYLKNGENSYRLISRYGDGNYNANTFACIDDILNDYSEIESHTIIYNIHNIDEVFVEDRKISVNELMFANESFVDYFSRKMVEGKKELINQPNTVFVTPQMAEKLFPNKRAIGQIVSVRSFTANQDSLIAFTVAGIIEPLPETSHLGFNILLSQKGHFAPTTEILKSRKVFGGAVYVKLYPNTNIEALEQSIAQKVKPLLDGVHGPPMEAFNHHLQNVHDIHFTTDTIMEMRPTIRRSSIKILLLVGLLIFAIATINFVNMHIARAAFSKKDSGIIRYLGGKNVHLFTQTFIEVLIAVTISFAIAIMLLSIFKISFASYFFPDWNISFQSTLFWTITSVLFIVVNVVVSMLGFLNISKESVTTKNVLNPNKIRTAFPLVIFQFVLVIVLIGFTLLINSQMNYINSKSLGYSSENVMVIRAPQRNAKIYTFREELLNIAGISHTATVQHYPGFRLQDQNFSSEDHSFPFKFGYIDKYAMKTLNIKPLVYFNEAKDNAVNGWLINEKFYSKLKEEYTDEQIATCNFAFDENESDDESREEFVILGVVKDFHYASLHSEIESFAFYVNTPETFINRFVLVRFEQSQTHEVIAKIENKMAEIYPEQPFRYEFLDEQLHLQYRSEQTLLKLINSFSVLAIFIACLGLIGFSIFMTEKRIKEIGIRKVNGARISEIMRILNKAYVKLVTIAFIIATPIAYFAINKWLENFAYRTNVSWWVFAASGIITLTIALLTVSWQTYRAARRNPVEALRYE